jgi:hypothetical protein
MAAASSVPRFGKNLVWVEMNAAERAAAAVLGYDAAAWDAGETPPPCLQEWKVLRKKREQLQAAEALGYTQRDWDAELMDGQPPLPEYADAGAAEKGGGNPDGLLTEYQGVKLILSDKSGTGYKGVCLRPGDRYTVTWDGRSHGAYSTAIDAAVRYAELERGRIEAEALGGDSHGGKGRDGKSGKTDANGLPPGSRVKFGPEGNGLATEVDGLVLHLSPSSQTGYKGVGKQNSGPGKQFQAHLGHGPGSSLGYFATAVEAAIAYAKRVQQIRAEREGKRGLAKGGGASAKRPVADAHAVGNEKRKRSDKAAAMLAQLPEPKQKKGHHASAQPPLQEKQQPQPLQERRVEAMTGRQQMKYLQELAALEAERGA